MKKTILLLRVAFLVPMAVCLVLIALFESGVLLPGGRAGQYVEEFYVLSAMELLAIIAVPAALYMFRIGAVKRRLVAGRENALLRLGLVRILMMALPMMADTLLYIYVAVARLSGHHTFPFTVLRISLQGALCRRYHRIAS